MQAFMTWSASLILTLGFNITIVLKKKNNKTADQKNSQQLLFIQCVPCSVQELKLKSQILKCMAEVHVTFKS